MVSKSFLSMSVSWMLNVFGGFDRGIADRFFNVFFSGPEFQCCYFGESSLLFYLSLI